MYAMYLHSSPAKRAVTAAAAARRVAAAGPHSSTVHAQVLCAEDGREHQPEDEDELELVVQREPSDEEVQERLDAAEEGECYPVGEPCREEGGVRKTHGR